MYLSKLDVSSLMKSSSPWYLQLCMNEHVHDMNHNEKIIETRERLEPIIGDSLFIHIYVHSCFSLTYMHAFLLPTYISHSCHAMLWP